MKVAWYTIIPLWLISCSDRSPSGTVYHKNLGEESREAHINETKTYNLIAVEIGIAKDQLDISEKHLYGKFFDERAEFYIVKNPALYISNTEVSELTLYFIDGLLCKKKYKLAADISTELMKSYGGFRFRALNQHTSEVSKSEKIVLKTDHGSIINDRLNRYQMKWEKEAVLIKYMVSKDSTDSSLELVEELRDYSHLLRAAELEI